MESESRGRTQWNRSAPGVATYPLGIQTFQLTIERNTPTLANITFTGEPSLATIVTMASVSSLDKDMRNLRLGKYTPQAANEVREWIEEVLGERMAAGDLLEALKDGSVLCKYGSTP